MIARQPSLADPPGRAAGPLTPAKHTDTFASVREPLFVKDPTKQVDLIPQSKAHRYDKCRQTAIPSASCAMPVRQIVGIYSPLDTLEEITPENP